MVLNSILFSLFFQLIFDLLLTMLWSFPPIAGKTSKCSLWFRFQVMLPAKKIEWENRTSRWPRKIALCQAEISYSGDSYAKSLVL